MGCLILTSYSQVLDVAFTEFEVYSQVVDVALTGFEVELLGRDRQLSETGPCVEKFRICSLDFNSSSVERNLLKLHSVQNNSITLNNWN